MFMEVAYVSSTLGFKTPANHGALALLCEYINPNYPVC